MTGGPPPGSPAVSTIDNPGSVDADGIDADALDVRSDGSADIALAGTVGHLALVLDGSGDVSRADS